MLTTADKRAAFHKLHESGCFIIPNPHDAGTARALQHLGFKALASTSAGFAWTIAKPDNGVTVDDVCDHLTAICAAVDIPVNADFEDGFAHEPDKVGVNVARAVKTGVAGLSIEDFTGDAAKPLFDRNWRSIVSRRRARRSTPINRGVMLTGRCEAFLRGVKDLNLVIDRLTAYAEAGADCLYAPGISTKEEISAVVKAVHPKPVNLLFFGADHSLANAAALGVRRISVGGSLSRMAWTGFMKAAAEMAEKGTFTELANGYLRRRAQQDVSLNCTDEKAAGNYARCVRVVETAIAFGASGGVAGPRAAPHRWSCRARCSPSASRHACREALRGWPTASGPSFQSSSAPCRPG